jgi:uncharacterized protein (TIGR02266 family)
MSNNHDQAAERRKDPRLPISVPVRCDNQNRFIEGFSEDLSLSGVFVATEAPPAIDDVVYLWFERPSVQSVPLAMAAKVRWHRVESDGKISGFGAEFADLTPEALVLLREILDNSGTEPLMSF